MTQPINIYKVDSIGIKSHVSSLLQNLCVHFLSSGGTSTGADVYLYVCMSLQKIGFETAEARLAPGSTIQV